MSTWDFSFAATQMRNTGKRQFRFRGDGQEILVDEIWGDCYVAGSMEEEIGKRGHLSVEADLKVFEHGGKKIAELTPPEKNEVETYDVERALPFSHYRVCANLGINPAEEHLGPWRLRNERSGELYYVNDYRGRMNMQWSDSGTHVFHDGPVEIDTEGVAHFR